MVLSDRTVQRAFSPTIQKHIQLPVMVHRRKYTWCIIVKNKKNKTLGYWVSCIRILDYRGSKLEARRT